MTMTRRAMLGGAVAVCVAPPAEAARLQSIRVTEAARVPLMRPNWPVPGEPHQLFYIQRSTNPNTIVYTARFDANGNLDRNRPANAYWRRFNDNGERMALRGFERRFAFGMRVRPMDEPGAWMVNAIAAPMFPMRLRQTGRFKAEVLTRVGGRMVQPVYCFVDVDESGFFPRVTGISMHGVDPRSRRAVSEYFSVSDGEFRQ